MPRFITLIAFHLLWISQSALASLKLSEHHMVNITSNWEFFPGQLISVSNSQSSPHKHPLNVKFNSLASMNHKADGFASFRKVLDIGSFRDTLAIKLPYCLQSCRFFINGKPVFQLGVPRESPTSFEGKAGYNLIFYTPTTQQLEIIAHVSSYGKSYGGLIRTISLGSLNAYRWWNIRNTGFDIALFSACLLMSFYHLVLFFLRPVNRSTLLFSLLCISSGVRILTANPSQLLLQNFNISVTAAFRFEYITFYLSFISVIMFTRELFKIEYSKYVERGVQYLFGAAIAFTLVAPLPWTSSFLRVIQMSSLAIFLYSVWSLSHAVRHRRSGVILFLLGFLAFCLGSFYDMYTLNAQQKLTNYSIIGLYTFLFTQASILALRFNLAFVKVEEDEEIISNLNAELEDHIKNLDKTVKNRTQDIQNLMEHTPSGICVIKPDLRFGESYSQHLLDILEVESLAEWSLQDFLNHTNLGVDRTHQVLQVLSICIGDDQLNYESNDYILPKELDFSLNHSKSKILSVNWNAILEGDLVKEILLTLNDITHLRKAEEQRREHEEKLKELDNLIDLGQKKFHVFIETTRNRLKNIQDLISEQAPDLRSLFVILHTLKGNARVVNFLDLTDKIHTCEEHVQEVRNGKTNFDPPHLQLILDDIEQKLKSYEALAFEKLKWEREGINQYQMTKSELELIQKLGLAIHAHDQSDESKKLLEIITTFSLSQCHDIFEQIFLQVDTIAHDLDKPRPTIHMDLPYVWIDANQERVFRDVFIHLLRNSLDHGIEDEESRVEAGKPRAGQLYLCGKVEDSYLILEFYDDGQGLDLKALAQKTEKPLTDEMLAESIFQSGLSTAKKVSQISGRGVGMDAVREYLKDIEGIVSIRLEHSDANPRPFVISLAIPLSQESLLLVA